ncbi:hypothetical protein ABT56_11340 [Photobacterium aquae]|uniref:Uncharacterized protein n=1 Tax=Photobacterium aquae TaxID=1195763 RepID=A0A0J1JTD9_9GAMM|nr:hypothetical protein [Photobacterium aquae]KLV05552.1 hypothetical protein ABT56_11340 [Photobacterium aquae]
MLCPDCKQPMAKTKDNQNHCLDINCPPSRTQCPECESANTEIVNKSISDASLCCKDCQATWTISRSQ